MEKKLIPEAKPDTPIMKLTWRNMAKAAMIPMTRKRIEYKSACSLAVSSSVVASDWNNNTLVVVLTCAAHLEEKQILYNLIYYSGTIKNALSETDAALTPNTSPNMTA